MFQALICPSSGAHDNDVDYHIGRLILELLSGLQAIACNPDATPAYPHLTQPTATQE